MQLTSAFVGKPFQTALVAAPRPSSNASRQVVTCMAKKKASSKGRLIVTLECTEARQEGATPSRYVTQKNKKTTPERLELKKYNKYLRRVTVHREIK